MEAEAELHEYGIHTEESDVRAHVSVVDRTVYVFPTVNGVQAVNKFEPPLRPAFQQGVVGATASGWLVKTSWVEDLRRLQFASWERWPAVNDKKSMSTSEKGAMAVACVLECMRRGRFPFWIDATEDDRRSVQLKGTDILVFCNKRVQVKCDWDIGKTGNLYLQKSERNPLKRY